MPEENTTPENKRFEFGEIAVKSKHIINASQLLLLRTLVWASRVLIKNHIVARNSLPALATLSNLGMIEDALFQLVAQSMRGMVPVAARAKTTDPKGVGIAFQHGLLFSSLLMIPVGIACFFAKNLFQLCNQSETTIETSNAFFTKIFFVLFFDGLYRLQARTLIGTGNTHWPLYGDILEAIADVGILSLALKQSQDPIDAYANAFMLSSIIAACASTAYLFFSKECEKYHFFTLNLDQFSIATFRDVVHNCLPQGIAGMMEFGSQTMVTALCGLYGESALIADSVAKSYTQFLLPVNAITTKTGALISESVTKQDGEFRLIGKATYAISGTYAIACLFALLFLGNLFVSRFVENTKENAITFQMALNFSFIMAGRELFDTMKSAGTSALSGFGDKTYAPNVNILFASATNAFLAYCATRTFKTSETTMYSTQIIGYFIAAILVAERWYHCDNLEKSLFYRVKNAISAGITHCSTLWKKEDAVTREVREMEEGVNICALKPTTSSH